MLYNSELLYRGTMRLLYGRHLDDKYRSVAQQVQAGESVLDVCCGPGLLHSHLPLASQARYLGVDVGARFVEAARRRGLPVSRLDISVADLPAKFDVVVLASSLYQFIPEVETIVKKLIAAARKRVVISEPIVNVGSSKFAPLRALSRRLTQPIGSRAPYIGERFTSETLLQALIPFQNCVLRSEILPGGREMLIVIDAEKWRSREQTWT